MSSTPLPTPYGPQLFFLLLRFPSSSLLLLFFFSLLLLLTSMLRLLLAAAGAGSVIAHELTSVALPLHTWLQQQFMATDAPVGCKSAALKLLHSLLIPQAARASPDPDGAADASATSSAGSVSAAESDIVEGTDEGANCTDASHGTAAAAAADDGDVMEGVVQHPRASAGVSEPGASQSEATSEAKADDSTAQLKLLQKLLAAVPLVLQAACKHETSNANEASSRLAGDSVPYGSTPEQPEAADADQAMQREAAQAQANSRAAQAEQAVVVDGEALHALLGLLLHAASLIGSQGLAAVFALPSSLLSVLPGLLKTSQVRTAAPAYPAALFFEV